MEYIIVSIIHDRGINELANLEDLVGAKIKQGFVPLGGPFVRTENASDSAIIGQAMTREAPINPLNFIP